MGNSKSQQTHPKYVEEAVRKKPKLTRNYLREFPEYGLVTSSSGAFYPHVQPSGPIRFHDTHGVNITISQNHKVASRTNSFCYAIAFTSRQIGIEERVKICLKTVDSGWSGVMRFGFTVNDPSRLHPDELPRYACPDLTNQPGYWAKALPVRFAVENNILSFYVTTSGCVFYAVNNNLEGLFLEGVDVSRPIWALFDVYGNTTSLQLINDDESEVPVQSPLTLDTGPVHLPSNMLGQVKVRLSVMDMITQISFSATMGRQLKCRNRIHLTRKDAEVESGLAFTSTALKPGQTAYFYCAETKPHIISIMEEMGFGVGVTTCDPSSILTNELPFDSTMVMDRGEYWVLFRDFEPPRQSEYFAFTIEKGGYLSYTREGVGKVVLFHMDVSQPLYLVIDMCAKISSLAIVGMSTEPESPDDPMTSIVAEDTPNSLPIFDFVNDGPASLLNFLGEESILNRSPSDEPGNGETAGTSRRNDIDIREAPGISTLNLYPHEENGERAPTGVYPHDNNESTGTSGSAMAAAAVVAAPLVGAALSWLGQSVANRLSSAGNGGQEDRPIPVAIMEDSSSSSSSSDESGAEEAFFNAHEEPDSNNSDNDDLELDLPSNSRLLEMLTGDLEEILRPLQMTDGGIREELVELPEEGAVAHVTGSKGTVEPIKTGPGKSSEELEGKDSEKECVICHDNLINAVVYSCGHACLCYDCGQVMLKQHRPMCPLCRARMKDVIRLFQA